MHLLDVLQGLLELLTVHPATASIAVTAVLLLAGLRAFRIFFMWALFPIQLAKKKSLDSNMVQRANFTVFIYVLCLTYTFVTIWYGVPGEMCLSAQPQCVPFVVDASVQVLAVATLLSLMLWNRAALARRESFVVNPDDKLAYLMEKYRERDLTPSGLLAVIPLITVKYVAAPAAAATIANVQDFVRHYY